MSSRRPFPWSLARINISPFPSLAKAKEAEKKYKQGGGQKAIGFSYTSSLKSMGRIPRSSGFFELGEKYKL